MIQPEPECHRDPALSAYVQRVHAAVESAADPSTVVERVLAAQRELMHRPGWRIPDALRQQAAGQPYTRNLIHQDPRGRFTVLALVWAPFQETPVHDHLNWCVVGALEGRMLATDYDREDRDRGLEARARLSVRGTTLLEPGDEVALLPPARSNIHRMSSADHRGAVTLHTYGDPGTRARIYDPATGEISHRTLDFHHR